MTGAAVTGAGATVATGVGAMVVTGVGAAATVVAVVAAGTPGSGVAAAGGVVAVEPPPPLVAGAVASGRGVPSAVVTLGARLSSSVATAVLAVSIGSAGVGMAAWPTRGVTAAVGAAIEVSLFTTVASIDARVVAAVDVESGAGVVVAEASGAASAWAMIATPLKVAPTLMPVAMIFELIAVRRRIRTPPAWPRRRSTPWTRRRPACRWLVGRWVA